MVLLSPCDVPEKEPQAPRHHRTLRSRCQWQWAAIPVAGAGGMLSMCEARKLGTPSRPGDRAAVPRPRAPPWGRWLDRDTNGCLNFQRIGESMQRPLELCRWKDREALPPVGKEYQHRSKRVNDGLPKVIKVPGSAVLRGCKKTRRKLMAHFQLRAGVHSQLRVIASLPPQAPRSSQEASQPAASEHGPSTPPAAKRSKRTNAEPAAEPNKAQGKAAKAKPAPQPGRWLDRDCNAVLNMQRIGESRWRPLELCWWPEQGKLPAKGKEYPGLGYKRLQEKPPKTQPAVEMAEVLWECHCCVKQMMVFFDKAGIGTQGGSGADAVLQACCKVVCWTRGIDQQQHRMVLVDEFCNSWVISAVSSNGAPSAEELPPWVRREKERELQVGRPSRAAQTSNKLPWQAGLLGSVLVAIAATGSIYEYQSHNAIFGVLQPDNPLWAPILLVMSVSGYPVAGLLFKAGVDGFNEAAEMQDKLDGYIGNNSDKNATEPPAVPPLKPLMHPPNPHSPRLPLPSLEDPAMLRHQKDFCEFFANPNFKTVYNQLVRKSQRRHPTLMLVFEGPRNQALLAKLQELGNINLRGWSGEEAQLFIKMVCGYGINAQSSELQAANLDKTHAGALIEEADKHRPSSNSRPSAAAAAAAAHAVGPPHKGKGIVEQRKLVFDSGTQIGVGIDPGVTQAVSVASGVWDARSGRLVADQLVRWKLTKGQVKHASGLNNSRRDTERWLAPIKPHLLHLAAASSAGTSLVANLKHITVTLATWDAVWEVYLDPRWAQQRLRVYGAQDRALEQYFKKVRLTVPCLNGATMSATMCVPCVHGCSWRRTWLRCPWIVDEHRATRVSSAVNGKQPCEEEVDHEQPTRPADWKPPAEQVEHRLQCPAWIQQRDQPVRCLMWCPVVAPRKPPQAPCSSHEATPATASEPWASTPPPAKRSKRTNAEPEAAEPTQPTKALEAGRAGSVHWSCAGGHSRQLYQPRARSTLAWATSGCETSHPQPSSSNSSLLRHSSMCPPLLSCHHLTVSACFPCRFYTIALTSQAIL
ncbi:hypothetical protein QJQ45_026252 [Haematococcus lacustris]|nr:hypothetical protein QJQ45_026252 [Haematococcus lacustris]